MVSYRANNKHVLKQSADDEEVVLEGNCPLSLKVDTRTNLYLFLYGYIQGLYTSSNYPISGCDRCDDVALPFSQMVYGASNVLSLFKDVISDNAFADYSGTEQLSFLYESYLIFWDFGINFDAVLQDDTSLI